VTRRGVALIRGEDLNPFELQAYQHVSAVRPFVAIGRANPGYEVGSIKVPVVLGGSLGSRRVTRGLARRATSRFPSLDPARLRNLEGLVGAATILHSAELVLPVSEQAVALADERHRLVLTCWETIPFRYDTDEALSARKDAVMARADRFVAVTELAAVALRAEGVDPGLVRVIPAAIDTDRFHPDRDGSAMRAAWGIRPDHRVILYVGRLIQEKGVLQLVRAVAALPGTTLVLLGRGPETHRVRRVAARLGVSDRVVLPGFVSYADLPSAYAAADVIAVPSLTTPYWEEQFGMVLAEAMASGRAIVTTRSGAIPEVVGDAAVLVDPYDVAQLATALADVLTDEVLRAGLEQQARRRAESVYALGVVGPQLEAMYAELD
jgi:starch synthase